MLEDMPAGTFDRALLALFVVIALALLSRRTQKPLQERFRRRPGALFLVPAALCALFFLFLRLHAAADRRFLLLLCAYAFAPAALVYLNGAGGAPRAGREARPWLDLAAVLLLWLPLEMNLGAELLPGPLRGTAHSIAYGLAVVLVLALFLLFRAMSGMKYVVPGEGRDALRWLGIAIAVIPLLAVAGHALSFIDPFHVPADLAAERLAATFAVIYLATALPEEILFRGLIQNWLAQRWGDNWKSLLVASIIFGAAHLNNGPGALPNWRYMILATVAGVGYGRVFQRTTSILWPAALHATVNTLRHTFF